VTANVSERLVPLVPAARIDVVPDVRFAAAKYPSAAPAATTAID
jgi:hypothetical protein